MQLLGWRDGSRLWLMGDDEEERDDEDENSNTPAWLAAGLMGDELFALPIWPDPLSGSRHLRQTNTVADLDGEPRNGWTLWHSHLGQRREAGGFTSNLPPYWPDGLLFHVVVHAGNPNWQVLLPWSNAPEFGPPEETTAPVPVKPRRRGFWRRLFERLGF
jgi:hypothetical protein